MTRRWIPGTLAVLSALVFVCGARAQDAQTAPPAPDALERGMTGELLPNTRFDKWEGEKPSGWGIWNPAKGCSAKPGPEGPDGRPTLELVPGEGGVVDLTAAVRTEETALLPGDTLLLTVTLKVDEGVPMEILLTLIHGPEGAEKTPKSLPFLGDGNWNTLQYTLASLPKDLTRINLAIRIRGAKQGTAYMSFASLRVSPQI